MPKPRKPKNRALPPNLYQNATGYFYYRNPNSKTTKGIGHDKAEAIQQARAANAVLATQNKSSLVDWVSGKTSYSLRDWLPVYRELWMKRSEKPPAANTLRNCDVYLKKLADWDQSFRKLPDITTAHVAARLQEVEEVSGKTAAVNFRSRWSDVMRMAETQGLIPQGSNPVTATYSAGRSVKRERLTLEQFVAIRAAAPLHLQRAMDIALLTAQRRDDITNMKFSDCKDGYLHVVQGKSQGDVRLQLDLRIGLKVVGMTIGDVIQQCRGLIISRYIVHHTRHHASAKPGGKLDSNGLSNMFQRAREAAGIVAGEGRTPPSFHEIRSLAERLYREQEGAEFAQALLGHKHASMTDKYDDMRGQGWSRVEAA